MKHAFLIMAHNEFKILEVLLSMLDDARNDIFLHIDKKSQEMYRQASNIQLKKAGFYLLENPIKVYWGDISQVKVEYLLFEKAFIQGSYAYYHLLSGVDLPIKSQDYIHKFFEKHNGKEFVGFWWEQNHQRDLKRKVYRYHLFTKRTKSGGPIVHPLTALFRNVVLGLHKLTHYNRKHDIQFKKGPNWVSITQEFCSLLIEHKVRILNHLTYCLCPDEIFLQTIIWNTPFRSQLYCEEDVNKGSARKIDWMRGNPYVWQMEDYNCLIQSEQLFARKFSSQQLELAYKIRDTYNNEQQP